MMLLQDDIAKDEDMHTSISSKLGECFTHKAKKTSNAGVKLLAVSTLDTSSILKKIT